MDAITKIFPNSDDLFHAAAIDFSNRAISAVQDRGIFKVVLLGGQSAKFFFNALTNIPFCKKHTPWNRIQFFFGDERYVPSNDLRSNYHTAYTYLFSKLPVLQENIYPIPTQAENPKQAALVYESTIKKFLKFDLIYLGLGENGHTASLMPLSEVVTAPSDKLVASLWVPELKMNRITLTPFTINQVECIIFLVTGQNKALAVWEVLKGARQLAHIQKYPAQLIECIHGKTIWYLDQGAAQKL